jgi:2-iminoacetate synthase
MSFLKIYEEYVSLEPDAFTRGLEAEDVEDVLKKDVLDAGDLLALLSFKAEKYMEPAARRANNETLRNFGRTIQLYTPIYISNHCVNQCVYCGFNKRHNVKRKRLSLDELKAEADFISSTGLKHILVLTGESSEESPVSYIRDSVRILKERFSSVSIETYALTRDEYRSMTDAGVDGVTIYQEVYDSDIYDDVHLSGPKKDYAFRLDAPERALASGMRAVNIGVLLGLNDWKKEAFMMALHAEYLQNRFPHAEISVSVPRIRPQTGSFVPFKKVTDRNMVQLILAARLFLPRVGVTLSTREDPVLRENLIPLGITRMSAGSTTIVGGHTIGQGIAGSEQFSVFDTRSVGEIKAMLIRKGYQPILKDWM